MKNINQEKGEAEDLRQKNLEEARKRRDNAKELSSKIANLDTKIAEHNASIERWTSIRASFQNSIAKFHTAYQKNIAPLSALRSQLSAARRDPDQNRSEISRISAKIRDIAQRNATILKERAKAEEWLVRVNASLESEKQKKAQAEQEKAQAEEDRGHEIKLQEYYVRNATAWGLEINRLVSQQRGVINQQQKINNTAIAEGNAQVESLVQENDFQRQA